MTPFIFAVFLLINFATIDSSPIHGELKEAETRQSRQAILASPGIATVPVAPQTFAVPVAPQTFAVPVAPQTIAVPAARTTVVHTEPVGIPTPAFGVQQWPYQYRYPYYMYPYAPSTFGGTWLV